jgi:hypothetical protein
LVYHLYAAPLPKDCNGASHNNKGDEGIPLVQDNGSGIMEEGVQGKTQAGLGMR